MDRQKRWQLVLIVAVLLITLYNILPTIFYYTKPLKDPIGPDQAHQVAEQIVARVDKMEQEAVDWLHSFSRLLHVSPAKIEVRKADPRFVDVTFTAPGDAKRFRNFLPRAGALIPFIPAQLLLAPEKLDEGLTTVVVERRVGESFDPNAIDQFFEYSPRFTAEGTPTPLYQKVVFDRVSDLAVAVAGESPRAQQVLMVLNSNGAQPGTVLAIAQSIVDIQKSFADQAPVLYKRLAASYSQATGLPAEGVSKALISQINSASAKLTAQKTTLIGPDETNLKELDPEAREKVQMLNQQLATLVSATTILQKDQALFDVRQQSLTAGQAMATLQEGVKKYDTANPIQKLELGQNSPFIQSITIDWSSGTVILALYPDIAKVVNGTAASEEQAFVKEKVSQLVVNDIARIGQMTQEAFSAEPDGYNVSLSTLSDSHSFLAFKLGALAQREAEQLKDLLVSGWNPTHPDLLKEVFPILSYEEYLKLPAQQKRLGLVVYAPATSHETPPEGFETSGIYVIARGLQDIVSKYRGNAGGEGVDALNNDIKALVTLLEQRSFMHYPGNSWGVSQTFSKDYIFRLPNFYDNLLKATREDFVVKGSSQYAVLDFTNVEQRILTQNRIEDKEHEELLQWRDEYQTAQVEISGANKYFVPAPTHNVYWDNLLLSARKYFRGDDSKVLKWGLDLSGGKTVRIGLTDQNGRPVTKPEDLNQAVNELYVRINKMGVAERSIRIEGDNIILDFPGSQELSASDLVKASTMYFHIVNEKFGPPRRGNAPTEARPLHDAANTFLQEVWNEAVVTNRKDSDSINAIAYKRLGGSGIGGELRPRSDSAKILWESGLRLANPLDKSVSGAFNDALSTVGILRGDDFNEWDGRSHPLIVLFHNYALEGSSLSNVQVGYTATEGNLLTFEVSSSYQGGRTGDPRDDFYAWTSQFAKDEVVGTAREAYTNGEGWRMAVVLNDRIITSPTLNGALRDRAQITGRFSQREVNQLAADLKAGSLSFTPRILSEQNISADLGLEERTKGIQASLLAIIAVVALMVGYYRFAGVVASVAVLLNLLIMWGVLQNIGAALTLPGIAGLVLTIGMAVDANVLVFERFREEFALSGRIASAIQTGYRKAFTAIFDSNFTTIIAALILTQFDSGPVKGFAVIIIIGVVSSMFTGLFMTRFFFAGWVQNPKHRELKMSRWIGNTAFDFLGWGRTALLVSGVLCLVSIWGVVAQRNSIIGMDFTGGYALTVNLVDTPTEAPYRVTTEKALVAAGAPVVDVQVKQLGAPNQLKIQLGTGMEQVNQPFHGMAEELPEGVYEYTYQRNPRITWVVNALEKAGLQIRKADMEQLDNQWTAMSGQFSDTMRDNALWALGLALLAILGYITVRFEFKYAVAAVIGLVHDVVVSLGVLALFHWLGFAVQLDLEIVGAVMMIIGYSLNDTIIVFDRVREDATILRKMDFHSMVNHALNITLSRTIMTSGTTLIVLICLVLFGGSALFGFSLAMTCGVLLGTFSSLFICAPIMLYFHDREEQHDAAAKLPIRNV